MDLWLGTIWTSRQDSNPFESDQFTQDTLINGHYQAVHTPPLISTHPHPPKIFTHPLPPKQNNVSPTQNNPHSIIIMPH